jgi:hypothetical protein
MSSIPLASYNVVIDRFRAFAEGHHMINAFSHGSLSLVDLPKDQEYPCMHVVPGEVIINKGLRQYTFDIVFFDRPRSKEEEPEYQREVISDCIRLAEDLIYEVYNGTVLFGDDVQMTGQYSITPFVEYYAQVVTGATLGSFSLIFPNDWNACDIPASYAPGGSGSGGSGSGGGGITLRVNGTNNAVQNILDLVQGTNIVIEDLGDGQVRIRATGGGGGGADWGSIGGTLSDQTDLQSALDARATDAELATETSARISGDATNASAISTESSARAAADTTLQNNINAEASTRASADTALQANIDTLDGELSTETTARLAGDATNAADIAAVQSNLSTHEADTNNPHSVTKTQVGLSNVDNTSDANKPISTATQTALDAKEPTITAGTTAQYWRGDKTWQTFPTSSTTQAIRIGYQGLTCPSSATRYISQASVMGTTQVQTNQAIEFDCTFKKIIARIGTAHSGTGTIVFTVQKNSVDTALTVTMPAGSAAGTVVEFASDVSFTAGDLWNIKVVNGATVTSAVISQISATYQ